MLRQGMQPRFIPTITGPLQLVTPPAASSLNSGLADAKLNLRVDQTVEDSLITRKLWAACRFCEEEIDGSRQFLTATYDLPVAHWWFEQSSLSAWAFAGLWARQQPENGRLETIAIPRPPLQSIVSVTYFDSNGVVQTLPSSFYSVKIPNRQQGTIERAPNQTFPAVQPDNQYPITIRFTAGYGSDWSNFPPEVQEAILLALGWLYMDRDPQTRDLDAIGRLLRSVGYGVYA